MEMSRACDDDDDDLGKVRTVFFKAGWRLQGAAPAWTRCWAAWTYKKTFFLKLKQIIICLNLKKKLLVKR
jgi:hypothetical protein